MKRWRSSRRARFACRGGLHAGLDRRVADRELLLVDVPVAVDIDQRRAGRGGAARARLGRQQRLAARDGVLRVAPPVIQTVAKRIELAAGHARVPPARPHAKDILRALALRARAG